MVKLTNRIIISFFIISFSFHSTQAQNSLDGNKIEQYLSTLPLLAQLEEKYIASDNKEKNQNSSMLDTTTTSYTPVTDTLILLENHPSYESFRVIVTNAKFLNPKEWASTGDKIMMAYSAYQMKNYDRETAPTIGEIKQNMSEDLIKIKINKFISPKQKQVLINKIENSMALLSDPNYIDNENISIISPFIGRLNSLFKETQ